MDCRQFLKQHSQFVDDTLSGVETWAMREHLSACEACARRDHQMRRALVLVRNAPQLDVSGTFQRRLNARLAAERLAAPISEAAGVSGYRRFTTAASLVVAAAGIAAVSLAFQSTSGTPRPLVMAPVVVTPPALPTEPVAAPAMFATVSSSLPVYPAMLLAQRATVQFAATHARTVSFQASH